LNILHVFNILRVFSILSRCPQISSIDVHVACRDAAGGRVLLVCIRAALEPPPVIRRPPTSDDDNAGIRRPSTRLLRDLVISSTSISNALSTAQRPSRPAPPAMLTPPQHLSPPRDKRRRKWASRTPSPPPSPSPRQALSRTPTTIT
jgi:hypothetical protein